MKQYPNLNTLKRMQTDMGRNTKGYPLYNPTIEHRLTESTKVSAYFRDLERPLLRHIAEADAVVGCVAWLTNLKILSALCSKRAASIILQKEDFLRPDRGAGRLNWKDELQYHYEAIPGIETYGHLQAGWLETQKDDDEFAPGDSLYVVGMRCVGHKNVISQIEPTMPRMHHKFLVFLKARNDDDPEVIEGAWPYAPYAVWTGSYNITRNGNASLENALFIQDSTLAEAYCTEWAQLVEVSEPLDWSSEYAAPDIRYNTGACVS